MIKRLDPRNHLQIGGSFEDDTKTMIRVCQNCGKGTMRGNKVAKARQELNYRSPRVYKPNLHVARVMQEDGTKVKMLFCTKCLRIVKRAVAERIAAGK